MTRRLVLPARRPLAPQRRLSSGGPQRGAKTSPHPRGAIRVTVMNPRGTGIVCHASSAAVESNGAGQERAPGLWGRWLAWWDVAGEDDGAGQTATPKKAVEVLGKIWELVLPDRALLIAAFSLLTLAAAVELAIPHYVAQSIAAVTKMSSIDLFKQHITVLAVCCSLYAFFAGLRGVCFAVLNMRLVKRMRSSLFQKIVQREVDFFDREEVGTLTSRLGSDCQSVARLIGFHINVLLRNLMQCIGGAIYLTNLSPPLAASCAAVTAILWGVTLWYSNISRKLTRAGQDALADTTQVAEEVFTLSRTVRTFGTEALEVERYNSSLERIVRIAVRYCTAYALYLTSSSFLFNATKVVTLACGGYAAFNGHITAEQLTSFVLYIEFVTAASIAVGEQYAAVMEAVGSTEKVVDLMDAKPAKQLAPGVVPDKCHGLLELRDVSYAYPTRPEPLAMDQVSITFKPGQLTALVGLSGSGKSTVMALLQRLSDPTSGEVLLDGVPLDTVDAGWYRKQIGVVGQEPKLFSMDIRSNISYGTQATDAEVEAAARASNAHEFISKLPEGYSTSVSSGLLSGGQKQRVVIARALVRKPTILLLDEATSALDAESESIVQETLDTVMEASDTDRTVVVIAHRLSTVRHADQIIVMSEGKVAEAGNHRQLLVKRGIYWDLVQRQRGGQGKEMSAVTVDLDEMGVKNWESRDRALDSTDMDAMERDGAEMSVGPTVLAEPDRQRDGHEGKRS